MKHGHIGDAFFDLDAAAFLLRELRYERAQQQLQSRSTAEEEQQKEQLQNDAAKAAVRQAEAATSVGEPGLVQPPQQQCRHAGCAVPDLNGASRELYPPNQAVNGIHDGRNRSSRDMGQYKLNNVDTAGQQSSSEGTAAGSQLSKPHGHQVKLRRAGQEQVNRETHARTFCLPLPLPAPCKPRRDSHDGNHGLFCAWV